MQKAECRNGRRVSAFCILPSAFIVVVLLSACALQSTVIDRLFFGTNIPSGGRVSEQEWQTFVREVVTPRFKDGLTIFEGNGQWLDPRGDLVREHVMIVEVAHTPSASVDADLRAIADEYKKRFHQDAVLRVTVPAKMVLY